MNLKLKNIGIWEKAELIVDGISIVAGENKTGKTTLGKCLYATLEILSDLKEDVITYRKIWIGESILTLLTPRFVIETQGILRKVRKLSNEILEKYHGSLLKEKQLRSLLEAHGLAAPEQLGDLTRLNQILKLKDIEVENIISSGRLRREFDGQIQSFNVEGDSIIEVTQDQQKAKFLIRGESLSIIENSVDKGSKPVYFRDELLSTYQDDLGGYESLGGAAFKIKQKNMLFYQNHDTIKQELEKRLVSKELANVLHELKELCQGTLVFDEKENRVYFSDENDPKTKLSIQNMSSGLKTMATLQKLIVDGAIKPKGTLIFDEPENHLHPAWQVKFSELIVLLQKALDLHVLLTTHSPYLAMALETYTKEYSTDQKTRFYFSELNGKKPQLTDVTENISVIYDSLSEPLQKIEDLSRNQRERTNGR